MMDDRRQPMLALNVGSSSLKFGLFMVGASGSRVLVSGAEETVGEPQAALARIAQRLEMQGLPALAAVGHRIVHGGPQCREHTLSDAAVMQQLQAATAFAPLHVPPASRACDAGTGRRADCFAHLADHSTAPLTAPELP